MSHPFNRGLIGCCLPPCNEKLPQPMSRNEATIKEIGHFFFRLLGSLVFPLCSSLHQFLSDPLSWPHIGRKTRGQEVYRRQKIVLQLPDGTTDASKHDQKPPSQPEWRDYVVLILSVWATAFIFVEYL